MEQLMIFYNVVESDLHSCWNVKDVYSCAICLRNRDKAHYTLQ